MSAGPATSRPLPPERAPETSLERALTCAFWRAVQQQPMPVMDALEAAARAVGALYRQAAAAHGPSGSCGCGWEPDPEADLIVLEAMLAAAIKGVPGHDLAAMEVAGRA